MESLFRGSYYLRDGNPIADRMANRNDFIIETSISKKSFIIINNKIIVFELYLKSRVGLRKNRYDLKFRYIVVRNNFYL